MAIVKSHEIKKDKIMLLCRRNLSFEKMDTAPYTGKNDGFWLLWEIFKEYIEQNIITAVLRKANAHSAIIRRLIKNQ